MSFAAPAVLAALVALPVLALLYGREQRRRRAAQEAFVAPALTASPLPRRAGGRRHVPVAIGALAVAVLIAAAARPQHSVAVPIRSATIMLLTDISDSMAATDVRPSRLAAAQQAALRFVRGIPSTIRVGQIAFARHPVLLQAPTTQHALTEAAIARLRPGGGGTAIGDAIEMALATIRAVPKVNGRIPPGAIVLLSDGASNVGIPSVQAAQQARRSHVRIDTIALGTPSGTIPGRHGQAVPVPVSASELARVAAASGGRAFTAADSARAQTIYAHLAAELGHTRAQRPLTAGFAGAGLGLLLISGAVSLFWFARLA